MRNTEGWLKIMRGNFTRKPTEVNFPSADWLSYLRTLSWLCLWAEFVCEAGIFFQRCFLTRRGHIKELQVKGEFVRLLSNFAVTVATCSFAYKQQKRVSEFFISKYFFSRVIFVRSIHIFLILFQKCSVTFHWNWIWQIADTFFLALWPRKRRNTLNKRKTKRDVKRRFRRSHLGVVKNLTIHFFPKFSV